MAREERDDEPGWGRQLLVATGVLVVVALLIGGVLSMVALGAARVTGLDSARAGASATPSLYLPSGTPTVGLDEYPAPSKKSDPADSGEPSASPTPGPVKKPRAITLRVFPKQVGAGQRINLTGTYGGGDGARLQVERFEAGQWTDFPVGASVTGGRFTTYVTTSRGGVQRFRVVDPLSDKTSKPVRVTVG